MSILFDRTMSILQGGMTVRRHRQAVSAGNIANADTPNFRARELDFGDTLQRARQTSQGPLKITRPGHLGPQGVSWIESPQGEVQLSKASGRSDGNNVNLESEMIGLQKNTLEYQALARVMRRKLGMLRFAVDNG